MNEELFLKIEESENALRIKFPAAIRRFLVSLTSWEQSFGEQEWFFDVFNDVKRDHENSIIEDSAKFREEWGIDGVVIAHNGLGDHMVLLPQSNGEALEEMLFVAWHETAEIRILSEGINYAENYGMDDFVFGNEYVFKLDNEGKLQEGWELRRISAPVEYLKYLNSRKITDVENKEGNEPVADEEAQEWMSMHDRLSEVADWIDDERTDKISEILQILNECTGDEYLGGRAHLLLNRIYMKGFGIPINTEKAIFHVRESIRVGNFNAMSDLAFYYLQGIGVEKNLFESLSWMEKANEKAEGFFDDRINYIKSIISQSN